MKNYELADVIGGKRRGWVPFLWTRQNGGRGPAVPPSIRRLPMRQRGLSTSPQRDRPPCAILSRWTSRTCWRNSARNVIRSKRRSSALSAWRLATEKDAGARLRGWLPRGRPARRKDAGVRRAARVNRLRPETDVGLTRFARQSIARRASRSTARSQAASIPRVFSLGNLPDASSIRRQPRPDRSARPVQPHQAAYIPHCYRWLSPPHSYR